MNDALHNLLKRVDTPTVCNAIEVVQGKRGFNAFTRGTMICSAPGEAMVGYARTARIQAVNPPSEPAEVIKARRMARADRHGAVVIPDDVVPQLEAAIAQLFKSEKAVFDAVKGKQIDFAGFEAAWAAFEASRT